MLRSAGHDVDVRVHDFFTLTPQPRFDVVLGNPPYIRYQDFNGEARGPARSPLQPDWPHARGTNTLG
jgi:methylase of polypeptide subunit release factors